MDPQDPIAQPTTPSISPIGQAASQVQQTQQAQPPIPEDVLAAKLKVSKPTQTYSPAIMSQTMAMLNPKSTAPQVNIGKSIATPAYAGLCLKWVDDQQGNTNRQPTAIADFQAQKEAGNVSADLKNIPLGARIYFNADSSNGNMGHIGLWQGQGKFISATDSGIRTYSLADWQRYTGQQAIGWAPAVGSKS